MPRIDIARTAVPAESAVAPNLQAADAANGMKFTNSGRESLLIRNTDASAHTVTVVSVPDEAGRTGDLAVNVPAGEIRIVDKLQPRWWNQRSGEDATTVQVDFSAATGMEVAVLAYPR